MGLIIQHTMQISQEKAMHISCVELVLVYWIKKYLFPEKQNYFNLLNYIGLSLSLSSNTQHSFLKVMFNDTRKH